MADVMADAPVADAAANDSSTAASGVGQKRARKDADEVPTAPVPDVLSLPAASIVRIIKSKLPDGVMVGTETKKAFGKACSLFILYLTTIAADIAKEGNRSTVGGPDVMAALRDLEFDDLLPSVESAIAAFREAEKVRQIESAAKRAARMEDKAAEPEGDGEEDEDAAKAEDEEEGEGKQPDE